MSDNLDQRSELARYIESLGQLYPGGLPQRLLKAPATSGRVPISKSLERLLFRQKISPSALVFGQGADKPNLMFLRFDIAAGSESNLSDPGGRLLQAAIEKGLKIKLGEVFVSSVSKGLSQALPTQPFFLENLDLFKQNIKEEIKFIAPQRLVLLGANVASLFDLDPKSKWGEVQGIKALLTLDVSDVAKDETLKKTFWEDLKLLV